jgi:hypothetical protein
VPRVLISRPGTNEDDAKLLQLHAQGKHQIVIAASLRRTPHAIFARSKFLLQRNRRAPDAGADPAGMQRSIAGSRSATRREPSRAAASGPR